MINLSVIKYLIFIGLLSIISVAKGQGWSIDSTFKHVLANNVEVDPLGNIYTLTKDGQITKFKDIGQPWYTYTNNRLGLLSEFDVGNPFLLLAYYAQYQIVVLLDNTLSETGRIQFGNIGLGNIRAVTLSDDNNIWVLDEEGRRVLKIGTDGRMILEGVPYMGFSFDSNKDIRIIQRGRYLYVIQPDSPIQVFDFFGKWVKQIDLEGLQTVVFIDDNIYYTVKGYLKTYNIAYPGMESDQEWPLDDFKLIRFDAVHRKLIGVDDAQKIGFLKI